MIQTWRRIQLSCQFGHVMKKPYKAADTTEWQCLVEKLGETTGEVDDSDESTTESEDYLTILKSEKTSLSTKLMTS